MIKHAYIHIPFCVKKCNYCAFCSFPLLGKKEEYLKALIEEIKYFYKGIYKEERLKTLYFGGGTPSLLEAEEIKKLVDIFSFEDDFEITLEMNPYQISFEKLKAIFNSKVNRLSLGAQTFDDEILKSIGRLHSKKDFLETLKMAKDAGFENISIDLMYGLPNQTMEKWLEDLIFAMSLEIEHISLYGLKIEDGTYFKKYPPKNLPDLDTQANMYEAACKELKKEFLHYEFSSFAKSEKYFSKHNLSYWQKKNYFGFGLSASGYIENKRYTNTFDYKKYVLNPKEKNYLELTKKEDIEEEIFLNLRTSFGLDFEKINKKYDINIFKMYEDKFEKFLKTGHLKKTNKGVALTLKGILVSNLVLSEFIDA